MTAGQLAEWQAYDNLDPIGEWRADFRMASLQAFIQNIVSALYSKKGSVRKPSVPLDFMPDWANELYREPEQMSVEQMKSQLMSIAKVQNKRVLKPKNNSSKPKRK